MFPLATQDQTPYDSGTPPLVLSSTSGMLRVAAEKPRMKLLKLTEQFQKVIDLAAQLVDTVEADALLLLLERPADWDALRRITPDIKVLLAADVPEELDGAAEAGFATIVLNMPDSPVYEKLTQALLESVADDILAPGAARGRRSTAASKPARSTRSASSTSTSTWDG